MGAGLEMEAKSGDKLSSCDGVQVYWKCTSLPNESWWK